MTLRVKRFEESHSALNLQAFYPGKSARIEIIDQYGIRMDFLRQENCAELTITESILFSSRQQILLILKFHHFNPFCFRNF